jgi:hypothetical protein
MPFNDTYRFGRCIYAGSGEAVECPSLPGTGRRSFMPCRDVHYCRIVPTILSDVVGLPLVSLEKKQGMDIAFAMWRKA